MYIYKSNIYIYIYIKDRKGENNNYNRVPGAGGWESKQSGSSNQRGHTQGLEKRRPSTLIMWEE